MTERAHIVAAKRIVIKVGSSLLAASPLGLPAAIADELAEFCRRGMQVVVVSSGAIALGYPALGCAQRPTDLPSLQAAAAIGQNRLLQHWQHAFSAHQMTIAQILLTHGDLGDRGRFLNARHALRALIDAGVVPIINENDTVATDEIRYGDNDQLAAMVCNLISADALFIYTDVNGLHDGDPADGGQRISVVATIATEATPYASATSGSGVGSGGMASKVRAAEQAGRFGVPTMVLPGTARQVFGRALAGEDIGTLFLPEGEAGRLGSRKHWLAYGAKVAGTLHVDSGAYTALTSAGSSLLPVGLQAVSGDFGVGALIRMEFEGREFARGLASYSAADSRKLCGCKSSEIAQRLGHKFVDEVVHRDDLVLLE